MPKRVFPFFFFQCVGNAMWKCEQELGTGTYSKSHFAILVSRLLVWVPSTLSNLFEIYRLARKFRKLPKESLIELGWSFRC